jgi:peptide deformylase
MIYPIIAYGDPILKKPAKEVEKDKADLKQLVDDMFETMYNAHGIGLAAPQIGVSLRIFIADGSALDDEKLHEFKKVFVNPTILKEEGEEWSYEEGCLSIPGVRADVMRQPKLKIEYYDADWKKYTETYDGMAARIIQHEYDHIEGLLFLDHISSMKKRLLKGKLTNISKGITDAKYKMKFPIKR